MKHCRKKGTAVCRCKPRHDTKVCLSCTIKPQAWLNNEDLGALLQLLTFLGCAKAQCSRLAALVPFICGGMSSWGIMSLASSISSSYGHGSSGIQWVSFPGLLQLGYYKPLRKRLFLIKRIFWKSGGIQVLYSMAISGLIRCTSVVGSSFSCYLLASRLRWKYKENYSGGLGLGISLTPHTARSTGRGLWFR